MTLHKSTVRNIALLLLAKQGRALSRHLAGAPKDGDLELLSGLLPVVETLLDNAARQDNGRPAWRDAERYRKSMGIYALLANAQRGSISIPLAAAQAAIALGLASGVASVVAWAQGLIGGVL